MNAQQALKILERLQLAAPPPTAAKIAEVADLLETLDREKIEATYSRQVSEVNERARKALNADLFPDSASDLFSGAEVVQPVTPDDPDNPDSIVLTQTEEILMQIDEAIRAPLETVRKQISTVLAGEMGRFRSDQYKVFEMIAGNNDAALHMLDNVTQMVALSHRLMPMDVMVFACPLLAREAVDTAQPWAKAREQTITVRLPEISLQAEGDYQRVLTILTDLLGNATQYSPSGSAIELSVEDLGSHVLFSVADNGIGLSEDDLEHVGRPFWRAQHQELVREQPGTGLRLYLSRQMLELQNGEMIFSGEEGVGSTFSFTLPAAAALT